jgi:hypothetical protein
MARQRIHRRQGFLVRKENLVKPHEITLMEEELKAAEARITELEQKILRAQDAALQYQNEAEQARQEATDLRETLAEWVSAWIVLQANPNLPEAIRSMMQRRLVVLQDKGKKA